jgi:hypothetical protein
MKWCSCTAKWQSDITLGAVRPATGAVLSPWWCAKPTAVLHIGDLSYAVGYAGEWEEWLSQIEPYAARAPVMLQLGNHERNWVDGRREGGGSGHYTWGRFNLN